MSDKLKIVITGATGFVGQHFLEDLDVEHYEVTIITRNPDKKMRIHPEVITILEADLGNVDSLIHAFEGKDMLINLAAEVRNISKLAETNIQGTKNLIEAIEKTKISKVIHLSSVGVVGAGYNHRFFQVNETTVQHPGNEYERTKLESENLFIEGSKKLDFSLTVLRPTNVFGEFHPFNALLNFMSRIQNNQAFLYEKEALVNYVYVKDLTGSIIRLLKESDNCGIINVGKSQPLIEFYKELTTKLNCSGKAYSVPYIFIKLVLLLGIKKFQSISNKVEYTDAKLAAFFDYPYGNVEGLTRTIEHYKKMKLLK